jgi:hypothetical protein
MEIPILVDRGLRLALLLPLSIAVDGCGPGQKYGQLRVDYFAVSPNPIPAPTVDGPTRFALEWQVESGLGYTNLIAIDLQGTKVYLSETSRLCNDACNGALVKVNCTSSLSSSAASRNVNCLGSDGATVERLVPVGKNLWSFQAVPYTGLNLVKDNSSNVVEVAVDLQ